MDIFPRQLLADDAFRTTVLDYLHAMLATRPKEPGGSRQVDHQHYRFCIEMLRVLHAYDDKEVVDILWGMVGLSQYGAGPTVEVVELLRDYDPVRTVQRVVEALGKEDRYHHEQAINLLELLGADEADALLIENVRRYAEKFERGSKSWSGRALAYWRKSLRDTIQVAIRRRLAGVVPHISTIALRYEPDNVKLSCIDGIGELGGEAALPVLMKLLTARSKAVRARAAKHLVSMKGFHTKIVKSVIASFQAPPSDTPSFRLASRKDAAITRIQVLRKIDGPVARRFLAGLASTEADAEIRSLAEAGSSAPRRARPKKRA
jgi:hypothetical protein